MNFLKYLKRPKTNNNLIGLIDFISTFAKMTRQKVNNNSAINSYSFHKTICGEDSLPIREYLLSFTSSEKFLIIKNNWKLIEGLGSLGFSFPNKVKPRANGPNGQLYNLMNDPLEKFNLYLTHKNKVDELTFLLNTVKRKHIE